ncbi:hypothetical protein Mgra_00008070 [Meloidogyne graminicola]|uniref:Uncharacterized protein n=1 Tax=Meloidogyne graminicola TaxID=189291 RepID=A0A8S9ZGZ3_9BILA|nr:hypothetical protein Mgra_00008070 [Meloidogyne graminicola]
MNLLNIIICLLLFLPQIFSLLIPSKFRRGNIMQKKFNLINSEQIELNQTKLKNTWSEEYTKDISIDHFSYSNSRTFKIRYLINTEHFNKKDAPIFYCMGDEGFGSAESDATKLGFLWEITPEFGAALVFVDHRYFGKSLPFGNESNTNISNLGYLSSEQSLADHALVIKYLKNKRLPNAQNSPIILFVLKRTKKKKKFFLFELKNNCIYIGYPHLTAGAIASSAPVHYFENVPSNPPYSYVDNIMRVFIKNGCPYNLLMASFDAIRKMSNTANGRMFLNQQYHLSPLSQITNSDDAELLLDNLNTVMFLALIFPLFFLTQVNFPYASTYYETPAYPIKLACKPLSIAKTQEQLAAAPFEFINVLFNTTGTEKDFQLWNYTYDNSVDVLYTNYNLLKKKVGHGLHGPPFDPFTKTCPFNETKYLNDICFSPPLSSFKEYNTELFRPNWLMTEYGYEYPTATNIIFSNGDGDAWLGGGWRQTNTNVGSIYSLIVKDGVHGYDLRESHPEDTQSVKDVRLQEKFHIATWIHEAKQATTEE